MERLELTIKGSIPSKKNSKVWTGHCLISSKNYREWEEEQLWLLKWVQWVQWWGWTIDCSFYRWDKRKFDLDNTFSSCSDLLVKAWIIEDDNMEILTNVILRFWWYDKQNPRCEIIINK